jgi:hypothetical protein
MPGKQGSSAANKRLQIEVVYGGVASDTSGADNPASFSCQDIS